MFNLFALAFIGLFLTFTMVFAVSLKLWPVSLVVFGGALLIIEYIARRKQRE